MTKLDINLKNQLLDFAEILNAFKSEIIQVKIADFLLDSIFLSEQLQTKNMESDSGDQSITSRRAKRVNPNKERHNNPVKERKPTGATKAMHQILDTDFFDRPQSIAAIANRYKEEFNEDFKTSEISGILLKSVKENVLKREKNQANKRYEYIRV